jgi:hypothetical protein
VVRVQAQDEGVWARGAGQHAEWKEATPNPFAAARVSAQEAVILLMDGCAPVEETRVEARKYDADELTKLRSSRAECLKAVGAGAGVRAP